jgi:hypothetical protein
LVQGARFADTVIGLTSGVPGRFGDLGPIVRFVTIDYDPE